MNRYGRRAMAHWQRADPARYATIPNPEGFFSTLGDQVEAEIQDLAAAHAGPDPAGESYLDKVGRLNMARLTAEEQVLTERVLIPEAEEDQEPATAGTQRVSQVQAALDRAYQADREDAEQGARL